jgi:HSP20 family protein
MALIRWRPQEAWDPFRSLAEIQDEMNRLFETSLRGRGMGTDFAPALDLVEEKDHLVVKADLPGMRKEDIHVSFQDNLLTIRGERKYETEKKETNYHHRERVYGSFVRSIELPCRVDANKVTANFRDGVLHVTLSKSEEAKTKEIEVNVSE